MSLPTPESVRALQRALYAKAKAEPACRFYALHGKTYRKDVLEWAWGCGRAHGGRPEAEGQTFAAIEAAGVETWLEARAQERRTKTCRAQAVRRVQIPKPGGTATRPPGIPTLKGRVARGPGSSCWERSLRPI